MDGVDLGREVRRIIQKMETTNPDLVATARAQRAWNAVADKEALKHTDAVYVVPGTDAREVIVYIDTQIWATELSLRSELLRLSMNIEIERLLEASGRGRARRFDDALFDYEEAEHIKRLRFVPSKERYSKRERESGTADYMKKSDLSSVESVQLSDEENAGLIEEVSSIQDPQLREAVYNAARANLELLKGKQNM